MERPRIHVKATAEGIEYVDAFVPHARYGFGSLDSDDRFVLWDAREGGGRVPCHIMINGERLRLVVAGTEGVPEHWRKLRVGKDHVFVPFTEQIARVFAEKHTWEFEQEAKTNAFLHQQLELIQSAITRERLLEIATDKLMAMAFPHHQMVTGGWLRALEIRAEEKAAG